MRNAGTILFLIVSLGLSSFGDEPFIPVELDFERFDTQFHIRSKVLNTPTIRAFMFQGTNTFNADGFSAQFRFGKNDSADSLVTISGTVSSNIINFKVGTNDFSRSFKNFYAVIILTSNDQVHSFAEGLLTVRRAPEVNAPRKLVTTFAINGSDYGPFTGDFSSWPFSPSNQASTVQNSRIGTNETNIAINSNLLFSQDLLLSNNLIAIDRTISNLLNTADLSMSNLFLAADTSLSNLLITSATSLSNNLVAFDLIISNAFEAALGTNDFDVVAGRGRTTTRFITAGGLTNNGDLIITGTNGISLGGGIVSDQRLFVIKAGSIIAPPGVDTNSILIAAARSGVGRGGFIQITGDNADPSVFSLPPGSIRLNKGVVTSGIIDLVGNQSSIILSNNIIIFTASSNMFAGNVIPEANGTRDLGSASNRWRTLFTIGTTWDAGGIKVSVTNGKVQIDGTNLTLETDFIASSNLLAQGKVETNFFLTVSNGILGGGFFDGTNLVLFLDPNVTNTFALSQTNSVNLITRILFDSNGVPSFNWDARTFFETNGTTAILNLSSNVDILGHILANVAVPTNPTDGANLLFVTNTALLRSEERQLEPFRSAFKMVFSDGNTNFTEIPIGANGTFLKSLGAQSAPSFKALEATATNVALLDLTDDPALGTFIMGETNAADGNFYSNVTASVMRTNLGLNIGVDVQAFDTDLKRLATNMGDNLVQVDAETLDGFDSGDFLLDDEAPGASGQLSVTNDPTLTGQVLSFDASSGNVGWQALEAATTNGDGLGPHVASSNLNMSGFFVVDLGGITNSGSIFMTNDASGVFSTDTNAGIAFGFQGFSNGAAFEVTGIGDASGAMASIKPGTNGNTHIFDGAEKIAVKVSIGGEVTFSNSVFIIGSVGVGTISPDASSILDLASTTRGFLPPRMTTAQRLAVSSPAAGLILYDTTVSNFFGFNGSNFVRLDTETASGCVIQTNTIAVGTGTVVLTFNQITEPLVNLTLIGGLGGSEFENNIKDQVTYHMEPQFNRTGGGGTETLVVWYETSTNGGVSWIKGEAIMNELAGGDSTVSPLSVCVVGQGKRIRFVSQGTVNTTLEFIDLAAGAKTPDHPIIPAYILTIN